MELRNNIDEVMDRTTRFCSNGAVGDALVKINYRQQGYPVKGLDQWNFPEDMEAFLDENMKALTCAWQGRETLDDDSIPVLVCNADSIEEAQAIVKFVRQELPVSE